MKNQTEAASINKKESLLKCCDQQISSAVNVSLSIFSNFTSVSPSGLNSNRCSNRWVLSGLFNWTLIFSSGVPWVKDRLTSLSLKKGSLKKNLYLSGCRRFSDSVFFSTERHWTQVSRKNYFMLLDTLFEAAIGDFSSLKIPRWVHEESHLLNENVFKVVHMIWKIIVWLWDTFFEKIISQPLMVRFTLRVPIFLLQNSQKLQNFGKIVMLK